MRKSDVDWRQFEKLVARIEQALAPRGATVRSPDRIRDLVTKRKREVDASIRYRVGSVNILITVECRKRKHRQDDTWIEQLATKRQKLGAARTIAVSHKGVSPQALTTAALYGIDIRLLRDIRPEEISGWLNIREVNFHASRPVVQMVSVIFRTTGLVDDSVQPKLLVDGNAMSPGDVPVFVLPDGDRLSLNQLVDSAAANGVNLRPSTSSDSKPIGAILGFDFPPNALAGVTNLGILDIKRMSIQLDIATSRVTARPGTPFSYETPGEAGVLGVEAQADVFGQPVRIGFYGAAGSREVRVSLSGVKLGGSLNIGISDNPTTVSDTPSATDARQATPDETAEQAAGADEARPFASRALCEK